MMNRYLFLMFVGVLGLGEPSQAFIGVRGDCTTEIPAQDTPGAKADVIFRAKALDTVGANTELEVIAVQKATCPQAK